MATSVKCMLLPVTGKNVPEKTFKSQALPTEYATGLCLCVTLSSPGICVQQTGMRCRCSFLSKPGAGSPELAVMKHAAQQARSPTPVHLLISLAAGKLGAAAGEQITSTFASHDVAIAPTTSLQCLVITSHQFTMHSLVKLHSVDQ